MEFFEVVRARHSIRAFEPREIEQEKLDKILETANRAPSAGDLQAYEIYLVRDPEKKAGLVRAAWGQSFIAEAPVVLVFCANPARSGVKYGERGRTLYALQDATIAAAHVQLAVTALGLGSVWVGAFSEPTASEVLGLPAGLRPIAIMPIGYPAETPTPTPRRSLADLVHEIK
jgi:nitroreductase